MNDSVSTAVAAQAIIRKTARGAYALGIRQVLVQGTRILSAIFLARLLTPTQFGFYAIVLYLQTFLTAFGDAGLAASLVRQSSEPATADYRAVFTIQQLLVLALTSLLWLLAPVFAHGYHLPAHDAWLFRLVSLSFLVTSFMVVPQVCLERRLAFDKLAIVESAQAILFNLAAVYLAWIGKGAYAFVWALLLRSFLGALLANYISPWKIGWHWDWAVIRSHLRPVLPGKSGHRPAQGQHLARLHWHLPGHCRRRLHHVGRHGRCLPGHGTVYSPATLHAGIRPTAGA
jgi:PST family polysaccharide transporter